MNVICKRDNLECTKPVYEIRGGLGAEETSGGWKKEEGLIKKRRERECLVKEKERERERNSESETRSLAHEASGEQ